MIDEEWEEPEEITVTLVDVAADLWWATDVDDNSWLLPHTDLLATMAVGTPCRRLPTATSLKCRSTSKTRNFNLSLLQRHYLLSEPDDGGVASDDLDRMMESVIVVLENQVEELDDMTIQFLEEVTDALYTEDEFADLAAAFGLTVRAVQRDGEFLMVTEDYSLTRVNVVVESGVVTAVDSIG